MAAPVLDLSDIQGDILRAYGNSYDCTSYLFVGIADAARGRAWLRGLVDRVTSAEPWRDDKPDTALNVALTARGLAALGVSERMLGTFSHEFRDGMAARAELLGDIGPSEPSGWDEGLGTGAAHVLATVNAQTLEHLEDELRRFRARVEEAGLTIVREEHAELLPDAREHFGYADGFAQPAVEGSSDEKAAGGGVPEAHGRWRPLAPGEFILGYPDEDSRDDPTSLPSAPDEPIGRNGTYMVWRKLYQDVPLFRRTLREAARLYRDGGEELLRAKILGRWPDGTPLVSAPDAPDPAFEASARGANAFRYGDVDPDGRRCPLGSHIRRSNPRDALGFEGRLTFRHRIIRRGMPYGPPLPPDATEDDGRDRGLVFVCFNASISRQFEGIQIQWLNAGNIFGLGHDKDFLTGDTLGTGKMTVQGDPPFLLAPAQSFVTTRGGEYLFAPGIRALGAIADGEAG